nr:molybdopterin-binding protein [uncultured Dethiosulfovibrio sp.]
MKTKTVPLDRSLGLALSHDLTLISPLEGFKGPKFKKGHVIEEKDLPVLRSMGRENLTVLELEENEVHEDDAAVRLAKAITGGNLEVRGPGEGKCSLIARCNGLLDLDPDSINLINQDRNWIVATLSNNIPVKKGENVASFRVLPLAVKEEQVKRAEELARPISILPYDPKKVALVTTGKELAEGRVKDAFRPMLEGKIAPYGGSLVHHSIVTDERERIGEAIEQAIGSGANLVVCTGGMSVDADDVTSSAIMDKTDQVVLRGIPLLPGCHFMLATKGPVTLLGVPAGAVFEPLTSLDILLPRIFAGKYPDDDQVRSWGVGGLCRHCPVCNFPCCSFASR